MNIIKQSRELSRKELYAMTKGNGSVSLKDVADGYRFKPEAWIEYEETNQRGANVTILSILCDDGTIIAFQSETAKRDFYEILDIFGGVDPEFILFKLSGKTKAGRDFVTLSLVM